MDETGLQAVLRRAAAGEAEAYAALVDLFGPRLYGFFFRLTRSRAEAEDLLQDTFVRLVGAMASYEDEGRFESWLFRIAGNLVRDHLRKQKRRGGAAEWLPDRDGPDALEGRAATVERPEASVQRQEQSSRLQAAIDRLPEPEREVVMLRHFSDMSFVEISAVMGTPVGTALARCHRGLSKLRALLTSGR